MKRVLLIIIWCVSCATAMAQGTANVLRVHQRGGSVEQFAIAEIDSIGFPDPMQIHIKKNVLQYEKVNVDSVTFAKVPETELYEAIDLGLSVKWAPFNIGATQPEQYGDFFAWGETVPKDDYSEATYTYYNNGQYGIIGTNICGTQYDAARQRWGGQWRLPTRSEIADLTSKCIWTQETLNGVAGYRVTGTNGNSIFLPAAGYQDGIERKEEGAGGFYWSGNIDRSMISAAYNLNFRGYDAQWSANRCYGFSVRAVK